MKRKYEALIVIDTKGKDDSIQELTSQIGKEIEGVGARLEQIDQLGKRKFPYNAQHLEAGFYVNYQFEAEPSVIDTLDKQLKLNKDVHLQHFQKI